eukprot:m.38424 g.38424  ORF g.38424 m.38424 type:complete len:326 (-) comp5504_c0_seq1:68-1045(-)
MRVATPRTARSIDASARTGRTSRSCSVAYWNSASAARVLVWAGYSRALCMSSASSARSAAALSPVDSASWASMLRTSYFAPGSMLVRSSAQSVQAVAFNGTAAILSAGRCTARATVRNAAWTHSWCSSRVSARIFSFVARSRGIPASVGAVTSGPASKMAVCSNGTCARMRSLSSARSRPNTRRPSCTVAGVAAVGTSSSGCGPPSSSTSATAVLPRFAATTLHAATSRVWMRRSAGEARKRSSAWCRRRSASDMPEALAAKACAGAAPAASAGKSTGAATSAGGVGATVAVGGAVSSVAVVSMQSVSRRGLKIAVARSVATAMF